MPQLLPRSCICQAVLVSRKANRYPRRSCSLVSLHEAVFFLESAVRQDSVITVQEDLSEKVNDTVGCDELPSAAWRRRR